MSIPLGLIFLLPVVLAVGSLAGAVVLRVSINCVNFWLGGSNSNPAIPEPEFSRAVGIALATLLAFLGVSLSLGLLFGGGVVISPSSSLTSLGWIRPISIPLTLLFNTLWNGWLLPTTFRRALAVTLLELGLLTVLGLVAVFGVGFVAAVCLRP